MSLQFPKRSGHSALSILSNKPLSQIKFFDISSFRFFKNVCVSILVMPSLRSCFFIIRSQQLFRCCALLTFISQKVHIDTDLFEMFNFQLKACLILFSVFNLRTFPSFQLFYFFIIFRCYFFLI